jgi:uncharacterized repeat protein (TIGR01451 family)
MIGETQPPDGTFTQVSGGDFHTCGIRTDGTVACWGADWDGQSSPPSGTFTQVSASADHTCGVRDDGTLACWGWNGYGESSPPGGTFTQVEAGTNHTCGIRTDGTAVCWGLNDDGQLGLAFTSAAPPPGEVGVPYSHLVTASGSPPPTIVLTSGSLPPGLGFDQANGIISGTPTQDGTFGSITFTASDGFFADAVEVYTITIGPVPDLSITGSGSPDRVGVDDLVAYTLEISNAGPADATAVTVTDTLPATVMFGSATASQGSCTGTSTVVCSLGALADGAGAEVTITVTPITSGKPKNTATVSAHEQDPDTSNNTAVMTTLVRGVGWPWARYIGVTDSGFARPRCVMTRGRAVQWNFFGPSPNGVQDGTGMGLFSSGTMTPVSYYAYTFPAAGNYRVTDARGHSMMVDVTLDVSPWSGTTSTVFTVTWAWAPAQPGYVFDVAIRRPAGTWETWRADETGTSATFTADAGTGDYQFKARMRNTGNGAASGWSLPTTITVS